LIRNAFSIALVCAFCSCLLSCSAIRQLEKDNMIQTINQIIELATHEMNQNNWISANYYLKNGLNILGYRYMPRTTGFHDDSGMRLILANISEKEGQLKLAARMRMNVLQDRFNQFKLNPL
jgi:Tfp pilus assembly protein PilF